MYIEIIGDISCIDKSVSRYYNSTQEFLRSPVAKHINYNKQHNQEHHNDNENNNNSSIISSPLWLSIVDAENSDIAQLGESFHFHPLTIEDCQIKSTREKLEIFNNYLFLVLHALRKNSNNNPDRSSNTQLTGSINSTHKGKIENNSVENDLDEEENSPQDVDPDENHHNDEDINEIDNLFESSDVLFGDYDYNSLLKNPNSIYSQAADLIKTSPIRLIIFPHCVVSFSNSNSNTVDAVKQRLKLLSAAAQSNHIMIDSCAWIIHAILDVIADNLLPLAEGISYEVDALEDLIYILTGAEHRDLLRRMGITRRRLSFLRQRLWSKRDILMSLIGKDWQFYTRTQLFINRKSFVVVLTCAAVSVY
jgi:Mg2+ and Co2+ transporter CorA